MGHSLTTKVLLGFLCRPSYSQAHKNILGRFLYEDFIPDRELSDTVSFLGGEEKEAFLDLAKGMLVWHPNARKTAGALAAHPFLQPKPNA